MGTTLEVLRTRDDRGGVLRQASCRSLDLDDQVQSYEATDGRWAQKFGLAAWLQRLLQQEH